MSSSYMFWCVAVCWSMLHCAALCCMVLQGVVVCCSVKKEGDPGADGFEFNGSVVAVFCTVLHCVAPRCTVLQCSEEVHMVESEIHVLFLQN